MLELSQWQQKNAFFNPVLMSELEAVKNGFRGSKSSSQPKYTALGKTV